MIGTVALLEEMYDFFREKLFTGTEKLKGRLYYSGTRISIGDEDGVLQSLSSSPSQFSSIDIALYLYCKDIDNGADLLSKDVAHLGELENKLVGLFPPDSNTLHYKGMKVRMTFLNTEARTNLNQHCVSAVFSVTYITDPRKL